MEKRSTSLRLSSSKPQRPIPRDIAESLGKLPPQALDIEETVLGQLLLESPAYDQVKDILQPDFFYSEGHQTIYQAIKELGDENAGINLKTVTFRLRKLGKLELVGGAYYLSELLNKASSTKHIAEHARILIELAVKRELIQAASQIHHDAYEDTTDVIELFDKVFERFQDVHDRAFKSSGPQKIKQLWKEVLILIEPDEPPPILFIDGIPILWPGESLFLVGKKKSRKTLFIIWLIVQFLTDKTKTGNEVLIFDTEQSKKHVFRTRKKIKMMSGKEVPCFHLKGKSPAENLEIISETVKHWETPPEIVVIDGDRDLMIDINDTKESTAVSLFIQNLTITQREGQKFPMAVIDVLHLNKSDTNPRGHIGTERLNKAVCTIELSLNEEANCTDVKCESSREMPFSPFSFTHDKDFLPEVIMTTGSTVVVEDESKVKLHAIFEGDTLKYKELVQEIKTSFTGRGGKPLGVNKAQALIKEFLTKGWLVKSGKSRDPNTTYKMIGTPIGLLSNGTAPTHKQLELQEETPPPPPELDMMDDLPF